MIYIIGGSGFIGTRLCDRLSQRAEINFRIGDKNPSRRFPKRTDIADVRHIDELRRCIPDESVIINLAAEHRDDVRPKRLYDEVNVEGAQNIVKVAEEKNVTRLIFTSSVAIYGFAPIGTGESGRPNPFNDYGRTKLEAEGIFREWFERDPDKRSLVILRPTVVFGEKNRGNVYNLLKQIASGRFAMIGDGANRKSMAYVENVAAALEHSLNLRGLHIYNYIDKPDFDMNTLVLTVNQALGKGSTSPIRIPYTIGFGLAKALDLVSWATRVNFPISSIRVKKFCSNSVYTSQFSSTGFVPPVNLEQAIRQTVRYEFIEAHNDEDVFYTE